MEYKKVVVGVFVFAIIITQFMFSIQREGNNIAPHIKGIGSWKYRKPIIIDNTANNHGLIDYQVLVVVNTFSLISAGKMRSDCGDIRFTDSNGSSLLNYWIESGINTPNTRIWVKVPEISAGSTKTIYMYYGNPSATSQSNGDATFEFFDDFSTLNTSKWNVYEYTGSISVNNGILNISHQNVDGESSGIISKMNFTKPLAMMVRWKDDSHTAWGATGVGFDSSNIASPSISFTLLQGSGFKVGWYGNGDSTRNYTHTYNDTQGNVKSQLTTVQQNDKFHMWNLSYVSGYLNITCGDYKYEKYSVDLGNSFYIRMGTRLVKGYDKPSEMEVDWIAVRNYTYPEPSISLGSEQTTPSPPKNLNANAGNKYVNLTWEPPSNDGGCSLTEYRIYRGTSSGGEVLLTTVSGVQRSYNDTSVSNGQTYYYYITAVNDVGESAKSDEIQATPITIPSAPQKLQARSGNGYVNLSWIAPVDNGGAKIMEYRIYRNGTLLDSISAPQVYYNDTSVVNGRTYTYYVTAVNSVGESDRSNEVQVTPMSVPTAPRNLKAEAGDGYVNLTWDSPRDNGGGEIKEYKIYRNGVFLIAVPADHLYYVDGDVVNGRTYTYYVTAVNSVGESDRSNEVQVTPKNVASTSGASPSLWPLIVVIVVVIGAVIFVFILFFRNKKRKTST